MCHGTRFEYFFGYDFSKMKYIVDILNILKYIHSKYSTLLVGMAQHVNNLHAKTLWMGLYVGWIVFL